ncbi:hypothetical protein [Pseudomonas guineae]|uniref:hypothetical protein n=1 Tax=Pseudomonas guineae TaxID=425504 RepID=UPI0030EEA2FB
MDLELKLALLGVAATAVMSMLGHLLKERRERSATRQAFLAEVSSMAEIARVRRYVEDLRSSARELVVANQDGVQEGQAFEVPIDVNGYRPVWNAYLTKLGCLTAHETGQIVRFYQLLDSVIRDVTAGGILFRGTTDAKDFEDTATVLESALQIADDLCSEPTGWAARLWSFRH